MEYFEGPLANGVSLVAYLFFAFCLMMIAQKTNTANSWLAFIPIVNIYLMTEIGGLEWWYVILCFVPIVNIFVFIYIMMKVCGARGKNEMLGLLFIVPCVNLGLFAYLAFSD